MKSKKKKLTVPNYSLREELINAISHGVGALLSIVALVFCIIKSAHLNSPILCVSTSIYGATLIILYTMSCIYHSLSPKLAGKKVLRVLDHCNVYLLVLGTYIPISLVGVGGTLGWILFALVTFITIVGIVFTSIDLERFQAISVICHLINGWSILLGVMQLYNNTGLWGVVLTALGGVFYSVGALIYWLGKKHKYMHCIFHFFCLLGSLSQFLAIYFFVM